MINFYDNEFAKIQFFYLQKSDCNDRFFPRVLKYEIQVEILI